MRWGHRTCPTHTGLQLRPQEVALSGSRARGKTVGTQKDGRRPGLDTKSKARKAAGEGDKVSPQTNCPVSMRGAGTCTGQAYRMGGQQALTPRGVRTPRPGPGARVPEPGPCRARVHTQTPPPHGTCCHVGPVATLPSCFLSSSSSCTEILEAAAGAPATSSALSLAFCCKYCRVWKHTAPASCGPHARALRRALPPRPTDPSCSLHAEAESRGPTRPGAAACSPDAARHETPCPQITAGRDPRPCSQWLSLFST